MKLFDCTTFYDEELIIDLRLNMLNKYVHKFIICEANFSHSGRKKELNFDINKFPKFKDKIEYVTLKNEPKGLIYEDVNKKKESQLNWRSNSVKRIAFQRNKLFEAVNEIANENDYIMYSDNDEIPNLENFDLKKNKNKIIIFNQKLFYYKFDLLLPNINWYGSKACKLKNLKNIDLLRATKNKNYSFYRLDTLFSDIKHQGVNIVSDGGWHFSNLKSIEELQRKFLNDENHSEYEAQGHTIDRIKENIKNKSIDYNHGAKQDSIDRFNSSKLQKINNEILPKYIKNNIAKYKAWFD